MPMGRGGESPMDNCATPSDVCVDSVSTKERAVLTIMCGCSASKPSSSADVADESPKLVAPPLSPTPCGCQNHVHDVTPDVSFEASGNKDGEEEYNP
jgi:hypothetical protein